MITPITSNVLKAKYSGYQAFDSRRFKVFDSHFPDVTDIPMRWHLKIINNSSGIYIWVQMCQSEDDDKWYICASIWTQSFQMFKGKKRRFTYSGLHPISSGFADLQEAEVYLILKFNPKEYIKP